MLGGAFISGVVARREHVHDRLRKKHGKLLNSRPWTAVELATVSGNLLAYLQEREKLRKQIHRRLRWPVVLSGETTLHEDFKADFRRRLEAQQEDEESA